MTKDEIKQQIANLEAGIRESEAALSSLRVELAGTEAAVGEVQRKISTHLDEQANRRRELERYQIALEIVAK